MQPGPRVMRHGNYLRVIVPPPLDETNTLLAIHVAETQLPRITFAPHVHPQLPDQAPASAPSHHGHHAPAPPQLNAPARPALIDNHWFPPLQQIYDEQALVEFEEEGPILYVWTWMINHESYTKCPAARIVKLDELRHLWLQDLLEPWQDELQADAPTQLRIVHGRPPQDSFRVDTVHIMIEQHPCEGKAANVISAVFHAQHVDRLLQAGFSTQRSLCTEDIIDSLQINHICELQRCRACIGHIPMEQFVRHEVSSGSSIELHVRHPICQQDETAASSTEPFVPRTILPTTANSLMQVSRRWHRRQIHSQYVQEDVPGDHVAEFQQSSQSPVDTCEVPVPAIPPAIVTPWPTTWQTLLDVWQFFFGLHGDHFDQGIHAEIWYSDHRRRPWSDAGRVVQLTADFDTWVPNALQAWQDWFLPEVPFEIQVVKPTPSGGDNAVQFHAIIVQHPSPDQFSCLIAVMDRYADPWTPTHACLLLPFAVDHWHLLNVAVVEFQCPPIDLTTHCRTLYGNVELTAGNLFPVQQAMCFTVTVDVHAQAHAQHPMELPGLAELPPESDSLGLLQLAATRSTNSYSHLHQGLLAHDPSARETGDMLCLQDQASRLEQCLQKAAISICSAPGYEDAGPVPPCRMAEPAFTRPTRSKHPVVLSLDAVLAPAGDPDAPRFDESLSTIQWLHDDNWVATCAAAPAFQLLPLPDGLQVPLESYSAMIDPTIAPPCSDAQWEVYVDGATSSTAASWSVVVVKTDGQGTHFHGQMSGPVETNRTLPAWISADSLDNIAAEFEAFVIALLLDLRGQLPGRVVLRPDLQLSRTIATFDCSTCSNTTLATLIRHLSYCLGHKLEVVEVRGHRQHPWNELADRLAKFALSQEVEPSNFQSILPLHQMATERFDSHWAWLQHCPRSLLHAFPPICEGQVMQFPLSLRHIDKSMPSPQSPGGDALHSIQVQVNILTANVLALDTVNNSKEVGRRVGARTQRLDAQWNAQKFHVLGLQETRTPQGVFHSEHYKIWSSGHQTHDAVCLGCEVWCHRSLPLATSSAGVSLTLADFQVVVALADPRRLIVKFECPMLQFTVVVLHTPCLRRAAGPGHRSLHDLQQWWQTTTQLLRANVRDELVWYFVDANAPLASAATSLYGLFGAETMNPQGELFEEFLQEMELMVPCTFERFHEGVTTTWTHPSGAKLRRDYVLVSQAAAKLTQSSFVLMDHDSTFEHEDHLPLGLRIAGALSTAAPSPDRVRWDQAKLHDPAVVERFQTALSTLPLPTRDVNIDEHCRIFETNVLQLARQFFEQTSSTKPRPQLCQQTLNSIAFKRHILDCGRAWGLMQDPAYKVELRAIEKEVRARVFADLQVHYDQVLVRLQQDGDLHNLKEVHRALSRLGARKTKMAHKYQPLPALRKQDGTLATSFTEQQVVWMQQFSEIEAGTQIHWQELQRLDRPGLGPPLDIQRQELFPSPWTLQCSLQKLKRGKAPGHNRLPPDILKAGAGPLCTQLCALTTKAVAHCKEPLEWKGGTLIPLSKGKPDAADPLGYRSIFISNFTAKLYHRSLRTHLVKIWEQGITSLQLGGRQRMGADLAHHLLQCHGHWATSVKTPYAHLFFDIKSAFYSVLRQALFLDDEVPTSLIAALKRFRVQAADIDYMLDVVQSDDATRGIDEHFRRLLKDALTNTHFFIQGLDAPCKTNRGTRPGDPLGDLLYNMVMSLILHDARQRTQRATGAQWRGQPEACPAFDDLPPLPREAFIGLAFVDDCAVAIHAPSISRVQDIVKASVAAMDVAARGRGLLLNYAAGKTEVMLHFVGRGSTEAKLQLHDMGNALCWAEGEVDYSLRAVHCYKHLGTWLQVGAKTAKEVAARGTAARQSWGVLHRAFYSKKYVSLKSKTMAFESLTLTRMLYNSHVWSPVTDDVVQRWQNSLRKPVGLIARGHTLGVSPITLNVDTLCGLVHILPPADLLHMARLRYVHRLLRTGPTVLWQMILATADVPGSWLQACEASFAWFRQFYSDHFVMPKSNSLWDWLPLVSLDSSWKGRVKAAGKACRRFRQSEAEALAWQKRFEDSFASRGGVLPSSPTPCSERWSCEQCDRWFASKKALAAHSARIHGYRRLITLYAVGDTCHACGKLFHARSRLTMHLRDAAQCLDTLRHCYPPVTDEMLAVLDEEENETTLQLRRDGWGATKALQPMRRVSGPLLPPPGSGEAHAMLSKAIARQGSGCVAAMQLQGRQAGPVEEPKTVHVYAADFPAFVMSSEAGFQSGDGAYDLAGLAKEYALLNVKSLVFVHFFSGFRRKGDLHQHLEHRIIAPGLELHVISVDLCLQKEQGNLLAPHAHAFWQRQIASGQIIGAGGGPPCETFTAARFQEDGPRALRVAEFPHGLPALSGREWRQVLVGSRLFQFLLDQLLLLAQCGGCGFCEHPQFPVWLKSVQAARVWAHPAVRALRLLRCCGVTSFDQCVFGAPALKPTTILHLRLPEFRSAVFTLGRMGRCLHGAGAHSQLKGLEEDGKTFRTARCKIYPSGLNQALADAVQAPQGYMQMPASQQSCQPTFCHFVTQILLKLVRYSQIFTVSMHRCDSGCNIASFARTKCRPHSSPK